MRKESSTNAVNESQLLLSCGMAYTVSVLGGRWKPGILYALVEGRMRYSELRRALPGVSERMLIAQLRELEDHGLVSRIIYPEVPPRVEYELTATGRSAEPLLRAMSDWGEMLRAKKERLVETSR
ncbi:winged helix-turn-helix transcriptional regulator [Chitinophaga lutea]